MARLNNINTSFENKMFILTLISAFKNLVHINFFTRKMHISIENTKFHADLMKNIISLTKKVMPHRNIISPRKIPKYLANGDIFPTLKSLYLERRSSMIRNQKIDDTDPFQEFDVE